MNYEPRLHIVLHQPEIPPNTGNVGRTCVAAACKLWLVKPLGFDVDEKARRRAGLDYWEHLDWEVVEDWNSLCSRLPNRAPWFFTKTATRCFWDLSYQQGDVLVFGSETSGLPRSLLDAYPEQAIRIPYRSQVRSLNLSNSVAIVIYEAWRQWVEAGIAADAP